MKKKYLLLTAIVMISLYLPAIVSGNQKSGRNYASLQHTARGRVTISNGTIVTDRGTLLRGCRISTDVFEQLPDRSYLSLMKQSGLNVIHLYAESFVSHTPGELHALVDTLVSWTEQDSLYLVITIGCIDQNGHYDYDFTMGFWNYYAPRYADKTHVMYEIHNEPHSWEPPYPDSTLAMEQDAYDIIRSHAPHTHILLFSYAVPSNSAGILQDIEKLGSGINWTNCSVATHGYGVAYYNLEAVLQDVQHAGYSIINTEPCDLHIDETYSVNLFRQQIRVHENNHVSYLHFFDIQDLETPANFQTIVEQCGIEWEPDFGSWPSQVIWDAYSQIESEYFAYQDGPSGVIDHGDKIGMISNDDYVVFNRVDFKQGALEFELKAASGGIGGTTEIRLDSPTGFLAGSVEIQPTGGWDIWTTKSCSITGVSGVQKLVLKFTGGEWDLFDIDWFKFTPVPTLITEDVDSRLLPKINRLGQNYPNPFNATTVFSYSITHAGFVNLKIYDILGREILTLVNQNQQAGNYHVSFNALNLSSGIYFYQLQIGNNYMEKRKMLLIK